MINPIQDIYSQAIAKEGISGKINNVVASFVIRNNTILTATPIKLGSLIEIGTNKYIVTALEEQFSQDVYYKGNFEVAQAIKIADTINTYAIINYVNGVIQGTETIQFINDKYSFKVPYCNAKIDDVIKFNNMQYKISSIDYSDNTLLTLYADYVGVSNTYTITLAETTTNLKANATYQIQATCTQNGTTVTNPTITYNSNNTAIATVSSTGLVTGVKEGSTTITCTYNGATATLGVTVSATVTSTPIKILQDNGSSNLKINTPTVFTVYVDDGNASSRILTSGRTFTFSLDEDTVSGGDAIIQSYTDTTVTVKAINSYMPIIISATDNADNTKTASININTIN